MISCYIGLGSNLNQPADQLRAACAGLQTIPKSNLICASSVYRTSPVGKLDQPDFLNATVKLDTELSVLSLFDTLQEIETIQEAGSVVRNLSKACETGKITISPQTITQTIQPSIPATTPPTIIPIKHITKHITNHT